MSFLSRTADTFYAFRFLRLLTTPWESTGAFKAGIVDKNGVVIKKPETSEEKSVYNYFHRLVFNVKRLLNKIPFGKSTIASYLTALYLIKEETGLNDEILLKHLSEITSQTLEFDITEETNQILPEGCYQLKHDLAMPKTGELLARCGSFVLAENNLLPVGNIFGFPQYEVLHMKTNKIILVNLKDLES